MLGECMLLGEQTGCCRMGSKKKDGRLDSWLQMANV